MTLSIPLGNGQTETISARPGGSIVFVGANGAGKTRLGVRLEQDLSRSPRPVHRIPGHRSLTFADRVEVVSFELAESLLLYGHEKGSSANRMVHRWGSNPATLLLSDYDHVLRALYAEQNDVAVTHLERHSSDLSTRPPITKLARLKQIWERLLPHRKLNIKGASITVAVPSALDGYRPSSLSDGERCIFYLIGQALLVKDNAILIVDEPELHIHKSILGDLWDEIEGSRRDLTIVYMTHDLDFATTRHGAVKYALTNYSFGQPDAEHWALTRIAEDQPVPEQIITRILGTHRPITFVEGEPESLDSLLYKRAYPKRSILPVGSHSQVFFTVEVFRTHTDLHRVGVVGLVDRDDQTSHEISAAASKHIFVIPVSEAENLLLWPPVFYAVARSLSHSPQDARAKTNAIVGMVFDRARADIDRFAVDYARRRLDRAMKTVGLHARDGQALASEFSGAVASIDVAKMVADARSKLDAAINAKDIHAVLGLYDNKGMLAEAAKELKLSKGALEEYVGRLLSSRQGRPTLRALRRVLPRLPA